MPLETAALLVGILLPLVSVGRNVARTGQRVACRLTGPVRPGQRAVSGQTL
jgi:hypothetical protein